MAILTLKQTLARAEAGGQKFLDKLVGECQFGCHLRRVVGGWGEVGLQPGSCNKRQFTLSQIASHDLAFRMSRLPKRDEALEHLT